MACFVSYLYFNQWASWVVLWWLLALPVVSLCISLPAMRTAGFRIVCPEKVGMNQAVQVELQTQCRFPMPVYKCALQVEHCLTGEKVSCRAGDKLQTEHCGGQRISAPVVYIYDYLGLFRRKIKTVEGCLMTVEPGTVTVGELPRGGQGSGVLRPKRGGGFSEEHDLRRYVPGDDLRMIHWKLSAKVGQPVVREPLEQVHTDLLLTVVLSGSRDEIDRKLGRLLWISRGLLERNEGHRVAVLTGTGLEQFSVTDRDQLAAMLDRVLSAPMVASDAAMPEQEQRCYAIGGDADGA